MIRRFFALAAIFVWIGAASAQGIAPLPLKVAGQFTGGCGISRPLPGDATTITWNFEIDVCAIKQSWCNGKPLFDIIVGAVAQTIKSVNCFPDVRKLAGLLGISPVFGTAGAPISKMYDQSGAGNDLTQTVAANRPAIWLINGRVAMAYDGALVDFISGANGDKYLTFPSIVTDNQNTTAYAAIQTSTMAPATTYSVLFTTSPAGSSGIQINSDHSSAWGGSIWFGGFTRSLPSPAMFPETQPAVIGAILGATLVMTQNEESGSSTALTAGTSTGGYLGAVPFFGPQNSGFYGRMYGFMIAGAAQATSGQQTALRNAFYGLHGIAKATPKYNMLVDGASLDAGHGSLVAGINGYGYVEQMLPFLRYPIRMGNTSFSGATIAQLTTSIATLQCNFFAAGATNVLIGPAAAAGNSITGGRTGAQAFSDLQAYITAYKACATAPTIFLVSLFGGTALDEFHNYDLLVIANAASMGLTTYSYGTNGFYMSAPMATFDTANTQYFNQISPYSNHPRIVGYHDWFMSPLATIRSVLGP